MEFTAHNKEEAKKLAKRYIEKHKNYKSGGFLKNRKVGHIFDGKPSPNLTDKRLKKYRVNFIKK